jgi:hypothetical protein
MVFIQQTNALANHLRGPQAVTPHQAVERRLRLLIQPCLNAAFHRISVLQNEKM